MKQSLGILLFFAAQSVWALGNNTGGMDGGGGGTLPAQPTNIYAVADIAQESKATLLYLLNGYEDANKFSQNSSLYKKLFLGPQKVQDQLKALQLEVRMDKPCFTSANREVDASIYGAKPNTICLSAFRIAPKTDMAIAKREIHALLIHEISHFMGTTEDEAIELQKDIAWSILNSKTELDRNVIRSKTDELGAAFSQALKSSQDNDTASLSQKMKSLLLAFMQFESSTTTYPYKLFAPLEYDYFDLLRAKLQLAQLYTRTLVADEMQNDNITDYNNTFNGKDSIKLSDLEHVPTKHSFADVKIYKLWDQQDLMNLLKSISHEMSLRRTYAYQVIYAQQWLKLAADKTELTLNPWQNHIGTYNVVSSVCSDGYKSEVAQFEVTSDNFFITKNINSSFSKRLEIGAYNINTYLNELGEIDGSTVYFTEEMGNSWSDRDFAEYTVSKTQLTTKPSKDFELTISNVSHPKDISKPSRIRKCIYTGNTL